MAESLPSSESRPRPISARVCLAVAVTGAAIVLLSLLPAWLQHVRNVGGHGLTAISVTWSAWEGRSWPFLPVATLLAGALALLAIVALRRPGSVPRWALDAGSVLLLALLLGSLLPLDRTGYASRVQIAPGWGLVAASVLALVMSAVLVAGARRGRTALLVVAIVPVVVAATYGGRVVALNLAEGDPRHYADGSYLREASEDQPTETLTIRDGRFTVGDRWAGNLSGRGLVVVLTDDPACPDARGAYRVFAAGGRDIRWNLIVDLCADGERGRDLTTGTWKRMP